MSHVNTPTGRRQTGVCETRVGANWHLLCILRRTQACLDVSARTSIILMSWTYLDCRSQVLSEDNVASAGQHGIANGLGDIPAGPEPGKGCTRLSAREVSLARARRTIVGVTIVKATRLLAVTEPRPVHSIKQTRDEPSQCVTCPGSGSTYRRLSTAHESRKQRRREATREREQVKKRAERIREAAGGWTGGTGRCSPALLVKPKPHHVIRLRPARLEVSINTIRCKFGQLGTSSDRGTIPRAASRVKV